VVDGRRARSKHPNYLRVDSVCARQPYCFMVRARDGAGNLDLMTRCFAAFRPGVGGGCICGSAADPALADGTILHPSRGSRMIGTAAMGGEVRIAKGVPESLALSTPVRISVAGVATLLGSGFFT
jgi:hypothetical protein